MSHTETIDLSVTASEPAQQKKYVWTPEEHAAEFGAPAVGSRQPASNRSDLLPDLEKQFGPCVEIKGQVWGDVVARIFADGSELTSTNFHGPLFVAASAMGTQRAAQNRVSYRQERLKIAENALRDFQAAHAAEHGAPWHRGLHTVPPRFTLPDCSGVDEGLLSRHVKALLEREQFPVSKFVEEGDASAYLSRLSLYVTHVLRLTGLAQTLSELRKPQPMHNAELRHWLALIVGVRQSKLRVAREEAETQCQPFGPGCFRVR